MVQTASDDPKRFALSAKEEYMENDTRKAPDSKQPEYDPPRVELVMDADELVREVHYAGDQVPIST